MNDPTGCVNIFAEEGFELGDFGARYAIEQIVALRKRAINRRLCVTPDEYRNLYEWVGARDRAAMLGVPVEAIERELDDGLGLVRVFVVSALPDG